MEPNLPQHDDDEVDGPSDLLIGKTAIQSFLVALGFPSNVDVYYLKSLKSWPIGKTGSGEKGKKGTSGGSLIASKKRLRRFVERLAARKQ